MVNTLAIVGLISLLLVVCVSILIFLFLRKRRNPYVIEFFSEVDALRCTVTVKCGRAVYQLFFEAAPGWIPEPGQDLLASVEGTAVEDPAVLPKRLRIYQKEAAELSLRFRYLYEDMTVTYDVNLSLGLVAQCLRAVDDYPKSHRDAEICKASTDVMMDYLEGAITDFPTTQTEGPILE